MIIIIKVKNPKYPPENNEYKYPLETLLVVNFFKFSFNRYLSACGPYPNILFLSNCFKPSFHNSILPLEVKSNNLFLSIIIFSIFCLSKGIVISSVSDLNG